MKTGLAKHFIISLNCPCLSLFTVLFKTKLIRFAESASSNIVLYSRFIWLNESIALIRAETEMYDIVRFSGTGF